MKDRLVERIERGAGVRHLVEVLSGLPPTDLQSLLLEVYQRRSRRVTTAHLIEEYSHNRFVAPSLVDPLALAELDVLAWKLLPGNYQRVGLSPVCPLGSVAAVTTVHQNNVLTSTRNTEVVADPTNVLALECAIQRRRALQADRHGSGRVELAASHRALRTQAIVESPGVRTHFQAFALCSAGRDEGHFRFEVASLGRHIAFYLRLLDEARRLGYALERLRVALTDIDIEARETVLESNVLRPLARRFPQVSLGFDRDRVAGIGYYSGACFCVYATDPSGKEVDLVDGGFTDWTQRVLGNRKERLLISGIGSERLCALFGQTRGALEVAAAPESGRG